MFQHLTPYCISGDGHPSILLGGTEVDDLELPGLITSLLTLACLSDWYIFPGIRSFAVEVSRYASSLRLRMPEWLTNQTGRTLSRVSVNSYTAFCVSCAVYCNCLRPLFRFRTARSGVGHQTKPSLLHRCPRRRHRGDEDRWLEQTRTTERSFQTSSSYRRWLHKQVNEVMLSEKQPAFIVPLGTCK